MAVRVTYEADESAVRYIYRIYISVECLANLAPRPLVFDFLNLFS